MFSHIADRGLEGSRLIAWARRALAPLERRVLLTSTQGAQTSIHCATHPDLRGGVYYRNCAPANPSNEAEDAQAAGCLWAETETWIARSG